MQITLFKDITTEEALQAIEKEASKYDGLYVEMDKKEQRKFVKDNASNIKSILKRLDRARIDKSKNFKMEVEAEALSIKSRLEKANEPFTLLIDEYNELRAKQLAAEKELQAAKDLAYQLPLDHEEAISMNELLDFKKAEEIRKQKERDELIAKEAAAEAEKRAKQAELDKIEFEKRAQEAARQAEIDKKLAEKSAAERAKQAEIERQEREKQAEIEAKRKLEENKKHVAKICWQAKKSLMSLDGVSESLAKTIVQAIAKKEISNVTINY